MPSRAACAGSEVPAPWPRRGPAAARRCSPATSLLLSVPRVRWSPSPGSRLSRPPSTTAPLPRPGGNSGRCAYPGPEGPAGTAGTLPTFTMIRSAGSAPSYTPAASLDSTATRRRASPARSVSRRTRRSPYGTGNRAPRQPIAASFGAGNESRGFNHWFGFPVPFCLRLPARAAGDDASVLLAGADRERDREVCLAGAAVAGEDDGLAVVDPGAVGERGDRRLRQRGVVVEAEVLEPFEQGEAGVEQAAALSVLGALLH